MTDVKSSIAEWLAAGLSRIAPGQAPPTFGLERSKQAPNQFAYVGTDSRGLARDRAEAAASGKAPSKSDTDDND